MTMGTEGRGPEGREKSLAEIALAKLDPQTRRRLEVAAEPKTRFRRFFGAPRVLWASSMVIVALVWIALGLFRLVEESRSGAAWFWIALGALELLVSVPALAVAAQDKRNKRGFYRNHR
ncbi:hypothetical protein E6C70_09280 [Glaciibacter flavus]|uniref:Uncharacterized protein n=1 Tax=Orlajensenia flava TaxID=2565934 RepID=A0A4S4FXM6_9MICO|nr:hypothetical protein [Glaciibacter flavus]THG34446.1 hypothetical protein E6C70_09280 [Glaciibacter flavus]